SFNLANIAFPKTSTPRSASNAGWFVASHHLWIETPPWSVFRRTSGTYWNITAPGPHRQTGVASLSQVPRLTDDGASRLQRKSWGPHHTPSSRPAKLKISCPTRQSEQTIVGLGQLAVQPGCVEKDPPPKT